MATTGYASALGGLAKDAVIGAGKGFVGGLKGAMMSEAPGIVGAYAFGKELRKRAGASKMPSGGSAPPAANKSSSSSSMAGGLGITNDKSIVAGLRQSNIINLEQIRQLKQLNNSVINQSKLLKFTIDDTKRKDQFAEEVANEQAIRDDKLLEAIRRIGSSDNKKQTTNNDTKESGFLGKIVDLLSDNIGKLILAYLGAKALGAVGGRVLGGAASGSKLLGGMAGRALPQGAISVLDASGKIIAGAGARSALVESISTVVPMVLRFLTGPIGLGIMAAAGIFGLLKTASNPNYDPKDARSGKSRVDNSGAQDSKRPLTKPEAQTYLEDANERKKYDSTKTPEENKTKIDNADRILNEYGGRQRVEGIAKGLPEYRTPGKGIVSSLFGKRDSPGGVGSTDHKGVDFKMNVGTRITPIASGVVIEANSTGGSTGLGKFVKIQHADGIISTYGHLSYVEVKKDEKVTLATSLGKSGGDKTDPLAGATTGPHLHLEVTEGGKHINPSTLSGLGALGDKDRSVEEGMYTSAKALDSEKPKSSGIERGADGILPAGTLGDPKPRNDRLAKKLLLPKLPPIGSIGDRQGNAENELDIIIDPSKQVAGPTGRQFPPLKSKSLSELLELRERIVKYPLSEKTTKALKVIDDEIKNRKASSPAVVSQSGVLSELSAPAFAAPGFTLPNFAKTNVLTNPNALNVASADGKFLPDGGIPGSGTKYDDGPISVIDAALLKETIKNNKAVAKGTGGPAVAKSTSGEQKGNQLPTKVIPPFKPDFKSNTEILAEANKQFLKELRSTFTGLARQGLKDALLPNGVGVSFKQATQDNLFRGQQLKIINDTTKKINVAAVDLLGKKYGPMFAPMLDKLSTSYFEVGSRLVGRELFTRFGELDAKETMGITGQVLGNIAAGKEQLAFEQVLFGMSGGRKSGIALNAESLFAKYGFEDPEQGISYFADVLGEKATQPFSKLMGADDRSKSIIRDPRTGKLVYADSGREASKDDIKAGYGGRISQSSMLGETNENMEVPGYKGSVAGTGGDPNDPRAILNDKGEVIGRMAAGTTNSSVTGGSVVGGGVTGGGGIIRQILNADPKNISRDTVFGTTAEERSKGGDALRVKEDIYVRAQTELVNRDIQTQKDLATAGAKREYEAALKVAKTEEEANNETNKYNETLTKIQNSNADVNAQDIINTLDKGPKGGAGDGTEAPGLKVSGRRSGQLFDANVYDKAGKIEGKDPMKEIGNFGFDMFKLAAGSELTKDISNPYMQTITNFAIQKGMNYAVDSIMKSDIFSTMGSAASSSSYGGYGGGGNIFSDLFSAFGFKTGGLVKGPGTGTSDSIPAMLSAGEFVINAEATKRNLAVLNAINRSTLKKADAKKTIKSDGADYTDSGGPGSQDGQYGGSGSPGGLGVGRGQGVSTSTQSVALGVLAFADKYPGWAPLGIAVQIAGWLAGKALDSQMEKMDAAIKAIDAIDKANAVAFASGSSRTFDPYGGQKGILSVSDKDGNIKSFDPYAGDSAKDADKGPAPDNAKGSQSGGSTGESWQGNEMADKASTTPAAPNISVDLSTGLAPGELSQSSNQSSLSTSVADIAAAVATAVGLDTGLASGISTSNDGAGGTASNSGADGEGCVDPSTLILLANGTQISAGKLKVGDFLHTLHEDTFVYDDFEVVYVKTVQQPKNIVTFTDGHNLTASDSHKFLMSNRTWKRVDALEAGDTIETAKGVNSDGFKTVVKIEAIGLGDVVKLTIDNAHTYVSEGLVSHNKDLAKGGLIRGPGTGISDSIPAMLSDGEYVINAKATKANLALLKSINSRSSSGSTEELAYNKTLYMKPFESIVAVKKYATGGLVARNNNMNAVAVPTNRSQYILSPPTNNSSSENQNNSSNMIIGPKTSTSIDNSSVTNFYNQASGMIDSIRSVTPQMA